MTAGVNLAVHVGQAALGGLFAACNQLFCAMEIEQADIGEP